MKYPTIRRTIELIHAMGLSASYKNGEFRIDYPANNPKADTGYYTNSRHDALFTAQAMATRKDAL